VVYLVLGRIAVVRCRPISQPGRVILADLRREERDERSERYERDGV
jgi:hypothetical protein